MELTDCYAKEFMLAVNHHGIQKTFIIMKEHIFKAKLYHDKDYLLFNDLSLAIIDQENKTLDIMLPENLFDYICYCKNKGFDLTALSITKTH